MELNKKEWIPALFHSTVYVGLIVLFNKGYPTTAFFVLWFSNLGNYFAGKWNHELAKRMTTAWSDQMKTTDEVYKNFCGQVRLNQELRNMNDRLHAVNQAVVRGEK